MTGSVRQVINKQLQLWKKQDTIDKKRNQLIIKDLEALEKEAKYTHNLANTAISNLKPNNGSNKPTNTG
jgi:hypothetical protein